MPLSVNLPLDMLPELPRDRDGPVFREPWEGQAFAMALGLHERGLFSWPEFASALADAIRGAAAAGDPDRGDRYYHHWLAALEALVDAKGAASAAELTRLQSAWMRAAKRTPHGQPIALTESDFEPAFEPAFEPDSKPDSEP
jgi:nitrile hydratase accessory protein